MFGLQWGDEGKGKIVDVLTRQVDAVVRYQGGANAGHTVLIGDDKYVLHHLPSGILRDHVLAVLGNGMVIEPKGLLDEMATLPEEARSRIHVSERAHVVLPYHKARDRAGEDQAECKIGTTLRGIGPAYQDKYARRAVRMGDLQRDTFRREELPERMAREGVSAEGIREFSQVCEQMLEQLGARISDTQQLLTRLHAEGKRFLFEGAQGALLDVDFGTYPFVTSSNPSFLGLGPGSGFSPRKVDHVLGVTKAYCTRVGEGPFPSELDGAEAEALREAGGEFGATTGRPRRCGWIDLPALAYGVRINDVDSLALTKADVLAGRQQVPVCVAYRLDGTVLDHFPAHADDLERVEPVLEDWPGWSEATPAAMKPFIDRLETALGVPVSIVSTGRKRSEVVLSAPFA